MQVLTGGHIIPQKTLKNSIQCSGIGLHSGVKVKMTMHPGAPDTGILFCRTGLPGGPVEIPATWEYAIGPPGKIRPPWVPLKFPGRPFFF